MNNPSLDKYHADKCREQEREEARINAEHYGNLSPNMPPCMMPDGGECCKEYADLNRAYNELNHVSSELADKLQKLYSSTCFGGTNIEELDAALDALQAYGEFQNRRPSA